MYPAGFEIYRATRRSGDFLHWVTCDDIELGLTTAVHESVHLLTSELDAYPLIGGGRLPRVEEHSALFAPRILAARFDPQSSFVTTYLRQGGASANEDFGYLLDELNAYTHDLSTAVHLQSLARSDRKVFHRDGLAALMAFVSEYAEEARQAHPQTWSILQQPRVRGTIVGLWAQAESVMGASCMVKDLGEEAPSFLRRICASTYESGIGQLLGRPPLCPVRCMRPHVDAASR